MWNICRKFFWQLRLKPAFVSSSFFTCVFGEGWTPGSVTRTPGRPPAACWSITATWWRWADSYWAFRTLCRFTGWFKDSMRCWTGIMRPEVESPEIKSETNRLICSSELKRDSDRTVSCLNDGSIPLTLLISIWIGHCSKSSWKDIQPFVESSPWLFFGLTLTDWVAGCPRIHSKFKGAYFKFLYSVLFQTFQNEKASSERDKTTALNSSTPHHWNEAKQQPTSGNVSTFPLVKCCPLLGKVFVTFCWVIYRKHL